MESKNSFDLDDLTEEQYHEIKEAFDSFDRDGRQAL
jgi:Ca2+-binding EF-hand superfamily protein